MVNVFLLLAVLPLRAATVVHRATIAETSHEETKVYSADGYHAAWMKLEGGQETWYLDRRKIGSYPKGSMLPSAHPAALSRDGSRLAVGMRVFDDQGRALGQAVFVNGVREELFEEVDHLQASGNHFSYFARRGGWMLMVDQRRGPPFGEKPSAPTFNADGSHFAYVANYQDGFHLLLDHEPVQKWPSAQAYISRNFRVRAWQEQTASGFFVADGKRRYGPYRFVKAVSLSDDGSRLALSEAGSSYASEARVYLDGQPSGPKGEVRDDVQFSPVSRAYWVMEAKQGSYGLYKDGVLQGTHGIFTGTPAVAFSPSGRRAAYVAYAGTDGPATLYVDHSAVLERVDAPALEASLVFDSERELHWIADSLGDLTLQCVTLDDRPSTVCAENARRLHLPYKDRYGTFELAKPQLEQPKLAP